MATLIAKPLIEETFAKPLDLEALKRSHSIYNTLPDDGEQPPVAENHLRNFAELFVRHKVHEVLGIHLIHGHFRIPENTIMLGSNFESPCGRWTKPTGINDVDIRAIHGHIFVFRRDGFHAYEYLDGPMPDLSGVRAEFIHEWINYIQTNSLHNLIGIQILVPDAEYNMIELIIGQGTVMLDPRKAQGCLPIRTTGWKFEVANGRPRVCAANEQHAALTSGNHKVYNAGKPLPKLETVDDLRKALRDEGIIEEGSLAG